ncbi:MAG TPA: hypothetical protein DHV68_01735 [Dehalococcoidia bacterium]|nr:hypothetical protein [Chloroflexota bacterium]HCI85545.1 hypothetical protein [Dehalococcoidia bacterium]|tara:strand:- start:12904 stop:13437 length:534 start_codon:yes stop_codon:yes gene_type:complete
MITRKITLGVTAGLLGAFALAGAAVAQKGPVDGENPRDSIKDRVAETLGSAMKTAREEHREAKQDECLAALEEAGTITQEQADEIDQWEDAKPEIMSDLKKLARQYGGVKDDFEATLSTLVEQEVITQAEADEVTAWIHSKPAYLEELRGDRDGKLRHGHGKHRHGHGRGPGFKRNF